MSEITSTLTLDHCWICNAFMVDGTKAHEHHCVPRNSGGADGPTVTLCSSHHNGIHDAALACYPHELSPKLNKWLEKLPHIKGAHERFAYLVHIIIQARKLTSKDVNKSRSISAKLTAKDAKVFDQLAYALSGNDRPLTHEQIILYAINDLHARLGLK